MDDRDDIWEEPEYKSGREAEQQGVLQMIAAVVIVGIVIEKFELAVSGDSIEKTLSDFGGALLLAGAYGFCAFAVWMLGRFLYGATVRKIRGDSTLHIVGRIVATIALVCAVLYVVVFWGLK